MRTGRVVGFDPAVRAIGGIADATSAAVAALSDEPSGLVLYRGHSQPLVEECTLVGVLGCPGAGKGGITEGLERIFRFGKLPISRSLRREYGEDVFARYTANGGLIPDEMVMPIVEDVLRDLREDYLTDGAGRTPPQAEQLCAGAIRGDYRLVLLEVQTRRETCIRRIKNRRICSTCMAEYALDKAPNGKCLLSTCGGLLVERDDASDEALETRFKIYDTLTAGAIKVFQASRERHRRRIYYHQINNDPPLEQVVAQTARILNPYLRAKG